MAGQRDLRNKFPGNYMNDALTATPTAPVNEESNVIEVEVEVRMSDTSVYLGSIFVEKGGRILDYFNGLSPFFALTERNGKVRTIGKAHVIQAIPHDRASSGAPVSQQAGGSLL